MASETACVHVTMMDGTTTLVNFGPRTTVAEVREGLSLGGDFQSDMFDLVFAGETLSTETELSNHGVCNNDVIEIALSKKALALQALGDTPATYPHFFHDLQQGGDKCELFMAAGLDLNTLHDGHAATHISVSNLTALKKVISLNPNIDLQNREGNTPLIVSCMRNQREAAHLLISEGCDINVSNRRGNTALHVASFRGQTEVADSLIKKGADINRPNGNGFTPLYGACNLAGAATVKMLITAGADVNASIPRTNNTALHQTVTKRTHHHSVLLLDMGKADPNRVDTNGDTPLHIAIRQQDLEGTLLLVQRNADTSIQNKNGETALTLAQNRPDDLFLKVVTNQA